MGWMWIFPFLFLLFMMVMMGKITIRGDMALAANIGNLFDVPQA